MLALSVKQPYATMIATGIKDLEIRSWPTSHRGQLLVCSSKTPAIEPAGCALAVVSVVDCRLMRPRDVPRACCSYQRGAYAWELKLDRVVVNPFRVIGSAAFYHVPRVTFDADHFGRWACGCATETGSPCKHPSFASVASCPRLRDVCRIMKKIGG